MSSDTTLPVDWPPLLDECRAWAAGVAVHVGCDPAAEDRLCAYRLSVLADLEIGASRDFWARKLAEWVKLDVGATAPEWLYDWPSPSPRDADGAPYREDWPARWRLLSPPEDGGYIDFASDDSDEEWFPERWRRVPGISAITDPAAALRLALLAVRPFPLPPELPDV